MSKTLKKALGISLFAFIVLYFGPVTFTLYDPVPPGDHIAHALLNLDAYLAWVVAGYLAAMVIQKMNLITGAVVGLFAACLVALYHGLSEPALNVLTDWRFWLTGIFLGALGGFIWSTQLVITRFMRSRD